MKENYSIYNFLMISVFMLRNLLLLVGISLLQYQSALKKRSNHLPPHQSLHIFLGTKIMMKRCYLLVQLLIYVCIHIISQYK